MSCKNSLILLKRTSTVKMSFPKVLHHRPASSASSNRMHLAYDNNKMLAWQIHSFGGIEQLTLTNSARIPVLVTPKDILVKVSATSINPIDLAMLGGYGNSILGCARNAEKLLTRTASVTLDFPCTFGRDFVGEVIECGAQVKDLKIGDNVWGVVPPFRQGSHSQYVLASADHVTKAPATVNSTQAGCVPYAGLTAWSALWTLFAEQVWPNANVLVLGASGGVGSLAVQMLKAWGSQVTATCSTDAVPTLESFGLSSVIDYKSPDYLRDVKVCGPFDVILNTSGVPGTPHIDFLKEWRMARYVTISHPLLKNTDNLGVPFGFIRSFFDIARLNVDSLSSKGARVQWGIFTPSKSGLQQLTDLVDKGKMKPWVYKTFKFTDLPLAYECQQAGHTRGKIVIEMDLD